MTASSPNRTKLLAKLRALRAMTVANGCTEAEALIAAERASAILQELGAEATTEEDVAADRYGARRRRFNGSLRRKSCHEVEWTVKSIAAFCECRVWRSRAEGEFDLVYFGEADDTETAHWLTDVIREAMEREYIQFRARYAGDVHAKSLRYDFLASMAERVSERLDALARAREVAVQAATAGTSRALVLVSKRETVATKAQIYLGGQPLKKRSASRGGGRSLQAQVAGRAAGDRAGFGRPVESGGALQIGQ